MLHDKSEGTLFLAIQDALLADEALQDKRIDEGAKAYDAATKAGVCSHKANADHYRAMLHDIKDGIAHRLMWKLCIWNREAYVVEVHPYCGREKMFPICWVYSRIGGIDNPTEWRVWGGLTKDCDGLWSSHQ